MPAELELLIRPVELKQKYELCTNNTTISFNQTRMELKPGQEDCQPCSKNSF